MSERKIYTPPESAGKAPGRSRLRGRRILVVGGGQMDIGEPDTPIGNGRAIAVVIIGAVTAVGTSLSATFQTVAGSIK